MALFLLFKETNIFQHIKELYEKCCLNGNVMLTKNRSAGLCFQHALCTLIFLPSKSYTRTRELPNYNRAVVLFKAPNSHHCTSLVAPVELPLDSLVELVFSKHNMTMQLKPTQHRHEE